MGRTSLKIAFVAALALGIPAAIVATTLGCVSATEENAPSAEWSVVEDIVADSAEESLAAVEESAEAIAGTFDNLFGKLEFSDNVEVESNAIENDEEENATDGEFVELEFEDAVLETSTDSSESDAIELSDVFDDESDAEEVEDAVELTDVFDDESVDEGVDDAIELSDVFDDETVVEEVEDAVELTDVFEDETLDEEVEDAIELGDAFDDDPVATDEPIVEEPADEPIADAVLGESIADALSEETDELVQDVADALVDAEDESSEEEIALEAEDSELVLSAPEPVESEWTAEPVGGEAEISEDAIVEELEEIVVEALDVEEVAFVESVEEPAAEADAIEETISDAPVVEESVAEAESTEEAVSDEPVVAPREVETQISDEPIAIYQTSEEPKTPGDADPKAVVESEDVVDEPSEEAPALEDQIWIVMANGSGFFCQVLENGAWRVADVSEFYSGNSPERPTVVWAHGFQTDIATAANDSFVLAASIARARLATGTNRAYRIVVWKWASERTGARLRVDAVMKEQIAENEGRYLANFIGGISNDNNVSFLGFSFGARVVGSALQTLACSPNGYANSSRSGRISLILASAGCDYGAFDYGRYARGSKLPSYVLNVYNPADGALRFYPFVADSIGTKAQGVAPIMGTGFVNASGRAFNVNVQPCLGREHSFSDEIQFVPQQALVDAIF